MHDSPLEPTCYYVACCRSDRRHPKLVWLGSRTRDWAVTFSAEHIHAIEPRKRARGGSGVVQARGMGHDPGSALPSPALRAPPLVFPYLHERVAAYAALTGSHVAGAQGARLRGRLHRDDRLPAHRLHGTTRRVVSAA
jgi:hypothetical protein